MPKPPKKIDIPPIVDPSINQGALAEGMSALRADSALEDQAANRTVFDLGRTVGAIQMARLQQAFSAAAEVQLFAHIQESNDFKHLAIKWPNGDLRPADSAEQFCRVMFGEGYKSMNERKLTLEAIGEEAYETAMRLGLNRNALRAARALPPEKLETVRQAIASGGTKAEVMSVIEDLAERAQKAEEKTLDVQAELQVSTEAREKLAKRIDKLEAERRRYNKLPAEQQLVEMQARMSELVHDLLGGINGGLRHACEEISKHGEERGEHDLFLAGQLAELQRALNRVREQFGLPDTSTAESELAAGAREAFRLARAARSEGGSK